MNARSVGPKQKSQYSSRKSGTNPRTGELLVPWQDVQVMPPEMPLPSVVRVPVRVTTDEGERLQVFKVRTLAAASGSVKWEDASPTLQAAAIETARSFGFVPVTE